MAVDVAHASPMLELWPGPLVLRGRIYICGAGLGHAYAGLGQMVHSLSRGLTGVLLVRFQTGEGIHADEGGGPGETKGDPEGSQALGGRGLRGEGDGPNPTVPSPQQIQDQGLGGERTGRGSSRGGRPEGGARGGNRGAAAARGWRRARGGDQGEREHWGGRGHTTGTTRTHYITY